MTQPPSNYFEIDWVCFSAILLTNQATQVKSNLLGRDNELTSDI